MNQHGKDLDTESSSLQHLMKKKSEVDLIMADIEIPTWLRLKTEAPIDLSKESNATVLSENDRELLTIALIRDSHVFQVLERQVFANGITMKDNCVQGFRKDLIDVSSKIKELKEQDFESVETSDLIEFLSFISHCNACCVPDLTTSSDVVSFL